MFLSPGTRSRKFQRCILLTFQAAGRRRRRLKRNPCADGKLLEIIASAETSQTLNESRAFGLSNGTRITHDVYMKDVGLRSTCTRFENFTIQRERRKGRREEERRSTKCEITGIGRDIGGENESGNSQCNKSRIKWISGLRREAQISEESNTMYTLQNKQTNKSETKRIKKTGIY